MTRNFVAALALCATAFGLTLANAQSVKVKPVHQVPQTGQNNRTNSVTVFQGTYQPSEFFTTAGSSAQFNTFGIAAAYSITIPNGSGTTTLSPLCGTHHWSAKNSSTSGKSIVIYDPRSSSIPVEPANLWVVWNDAAANLAANGAVCYFASVDSIVGVRSYFANATLQIGSGWVNQAGANLVPLIGNDTTLPQNIYNIINNSLITAANTDIRAEDAKFATIRSLTAAGTQVSARAVTGLGYGTSGSGTGSAIKSSFSTTVANPTDFAMACFATSSGQSCETDSISGAPTPREYVDVSIGAAPVMVFINTNNTANGHLGDGNYTNINRFILARALKGGIIHTRDLAYNAPALPTAGGQGQGTPQTYPDVPLNVFLREPLSGTYNTMEWSIPNSSEIDAFAWSPGIVSGQETGVNPSVTATCTYTGFSLPGTGTTIVPLANTPCGLASVTNAGNPLWQVASNGATRGRAVGTGEMVKAVNAVADSLGYAFWGFSNFAGYNNIKYLTVDGVDPLFGTTTATANPGGVGVFPTCQTTSGVATSCLQIPFTNILNGTYPIWSKYRLIYDPFTYAQGNIAPTVVTYAQYASDPVNGVIQDMVPANAMQVFHSHYAQQVVDQPIAASGGGSYSAYSPNNGFKTGVPETGGDMGGAVLTINSELDFINDVGNQQVNLKQ
ncbi:MAG: hypothetical protein WCE75_09940 [Terracidiphilus sp.]